MKINPKCWWGGHDLFNSSHDWQCARCGEEIDYHQAVQVSAKTKLLGWFMAKKSWLKCPDCGQRFGKHDPDVSHVPF